MNTPDFDDLTPPPELVRDWWERHGRIVGDVAAQAARWGAQHGWRQARQLWPELIRDRPPTEADGDEQGWVMILSDGVWRPWMWNQVGSHAWLHTPRWRPPAPKVPTREEALAIIERKRASSWHFSVDEMSVIIGALEGGEGEG